MELVYIYIYIYIYIFTEDVMLVAKGLYVQFQILTSNDGDINLIRYFFFYSDRCFILGTHLNFIKLFPDKGINSVYGFDIFFFAVYEFL